LLDEAAATLLVVSSATSTAASLSLSLSQAMCDRCEWPPPMT
jgi:hypothetical protein